MILGAGQLGVPGDHSWCMQAAANFITAGFLSQSMEIISEVYLVGAMLPPLPPPLFCSPPFLPLFNIA